MAKKPIAVIAVVNCCHGGPGEDGTLQGIFDLAGIRYTGPGQAASALGMDKFAFGAAMAAAGLPTLPRVLVGIPTVTPPFRVHTSSSPALADRRSGSKSWRIGRPPSRSSKASPYFAAGGVVEPFLAESRDLQLAVRTWPALEMSAIEEPVRGGGGIYSYSQKYLAWGGEVSGGRELPARVDRGHDRALCDSWPRR